MRNPRIYLNQALAVNTQVQLSDDAFGHVVRVLRLSDGDPITLFNGQINEGETAPYYAQYQARLVNVTKKQAFAQIEGEQIVENESPLNIHLGQGISRGDRMDFTLQKSVELGVQTITPLFTERCGVKLTGDRLKKKQEQWQKIVISACEQSGRCLVPEVKAPVSLSEWQTQQTEALKLNLHPRAQHSIMSLPVETNQVRLLIGPEGGLSDEEINSARDAGFTDVLLGPRVLRTETAALTAITALQCRFGDL
ncbi:16S rRNA (uracil(1498)-N(3))-methyltransferase [Thalassotalea euphylliae]|uniref:Ribosomal RNA small subunit methyltransferase E n=1 Tax=Thalassotalea euphylliae TaxID=1655234 RepID=A0A3E0U657_9GAMM|nr:16S rRNA (uracil(1498)-N(3))-methyltransferase [Thalassotalea euphylliae]REL32204.1 16S rRNA (uracil(1498)-N(3))-methyltransferase [Thalassotalea euphylliae]